MVLLYHFPKGPALIRTARDYYIYCDRRTVTYEDGQGRYDPQVDYTFEPGEFVFTNREFEVGHFVNRLGLRDDEASLDGPDVIVLGDSHASGWGVDQSASFPELIESATELRVLNAAIPSFATPRQMRLLERLDRSRLRALVIQYAENDYAENRWFGEHENEPRVMSREEFEKNRQSYKSVDRAYFPFKFLRIYWPMLYRNLTEYRSSSPVPTHLLPEREPVKEAEAFLNVLVNGDADLSGVPTIVLEVISYNANSSAFVRAVDSLSQILPFAEDPRMPIIRTVDVAPVLRDQDYLLYDDHMSASGHHRVADMLIPLIECWTGEGTGCGPEQDIR